MAYSGQPRRRARRLGMPVRIEQIRGDEGDYPIEPSYFNPTPSVLANKGEVIQTASGPLVIEPIRATQQVLNAGTGQPSVAIQSSGTDAAASNLPVGPTATTLTTTQTPASPTTPSTGLFQKIPPWGWALAAIGLLVWLGNENK